MALVSIQITREVCTVGNVHELEYLQEKIEQLKKDGVYRQLPVLEGGQ